MRFRWHDVSVDILKQVDITDRAQTISPVLSGDDVMAPGFF